MIFQKCLSLYFQIQQRRFRIYLKNTKHQTNHFSSVSNIFFRNLIPQLARSSWGEYMGENDNGICTKDFVIKYFKDIDEYKKFAQSSAEQTIRRSKEREWRKVLLE